MKAIDRFDGAGGFTTGARLAGIEVVRSANHWPAHGLLLASPACQGRSLAQRRERSHHAAARATAWAVVSCAEYHQSPVVLVENVPGFLTHWARYPAWRLTREALGDTVSPQVIDAADHGVPLHRKRLFVVGTRSTHPLQRFLPCRSLDRPFGTVTTRDRWAIVKGDRMRMFQPTEYRACMGFPDNYQLPRNRADAIALLSSAVAPPVARDLIQALRQAA